MHIHSHKQIPVQTSAQLVNMDWVKTMKLALIWLVALNVLLESTSIKQESTCAKYARLDNTKKKKDKCRAKSAKLVPICLIQEALTFFMVQNFHAKHALVLLVSAHSMNKYGRF